MLGLSMLGPPIRVNQKLAILILTILILLVSSSATINRHYSQGKTPVPFLQGPLGSVQVQPSSATYWFQVGAIGDGSNTGYTGANVTIRTVYDLAVNDAHSYWVGGYISNLAFIQVGYLTTIATDGTPYCCAWFWEYFPAGSGTNCGTICAPHIGPDNSAGPIGSFHEYSMISNNTGVWMFYMDGKLLGSTENLGAPSSGNNPPAALAEVADTTTDKDVLGPAEFVNMTIRNPGWHPVTRGLGKIGYGAPSAMQLANPYGSAGVTGVNNDFLAGSGLPQPASGGGTQFWPSTGLLPYRVSFNFEDVNGKTIRPDWISLYDTGNSADRIFYTRYSDQSIAQASTVWSLNVTSWHNANVSPLSNPTLDVTRTSVFNVTTRIFPLNLRIIGALFPLPVSGARLQTNLPDSLSLNMTSNQNGEATFSQLPFGTYRIHILVPRGVQTTVYPILSEPTSLTVKVVGLPELVTAITVPILVGAIIIVVAVRKERERRRVWESTVTLPPAEEPQHGSHPSTESSP